MTFTCESYIHSSNFVNYFEELWVEKARKHDAVCKLLQITRRTLRDYLSGKKFPPPSVVATLFYEARGKEILYPDVMNERALYYSLSKTRQEVIDKLNLHIETLTADLEAAKALGATRLDVSSNEPIFCAEEMFRRAKLAEYQPFAFSIAPRPVYQPPVLSHAALPVPAYAKPMQVRVDREQARLNHASR